MARIIVDEKVCKGCSMCIHACPKKIIALAKDRLNAKGYHPAEPVSYTHLTLPTNREV